MRLASWPLGHRPDLHGSLWSSPSRPARTGALATCRLRRGRAGDGVLPLLQQEQPPLRHVRLAHLTTDRFEIFYYPALKPHLERVANYAESAYQKVSADLKHDLSFKVPLVIFKTHSEFEQENIDPSGAQEGVGAFAEPCRGDRTHAAHRYRRSALDLFLFELIAHELTHIFQFDIIPQGLIPARRAAVGAAGGEPIYEPPSGRRWT